MSARQTSPYDSIARKWLALAERRKAHFIELRESGRWRHYYKSAELLEAIRDAGRMCNAWARIVGMPEDDETSA